MGGVQESAPDCILQSGGKPKQNTGFAPSCGGHCQLATWNSWFHADCTLIAVFLHSDCTFRGLLGPVQAPDRGHERSAEGEAVDGNMKALLQDVSQQLVVLAVEPKLPCSDGYQSVDSCLSSSPVNDCLARSAEAAE